MRLQHKITAITGAGRGIGRAAALLFAREGARVMILELDPRAGREVEGEIRAQGGKAEWIGVDVADLESTRAAFAEIGTRCGRLDVLYNNASIFLGGRDGRVSDLDEAVWKKVLDVNLSGIYHGCRFGIPLMRGKGGSIITTASSAGVIGIPGCDAYTASKGATVALTRSMAVEYGPENIRVNCIAPAAIRTDMIHESNLRDPSFDERRFLATTPLRRWGMPEEIAKIALFLASDDASYMNGAILVADGGITIT
ncbi:MAG TPA: SDR family NAD(P)-dependent oxidoreductase [Chthoniobacteraceae bacterium]|nr:SDR family NAD(P)-dependent oxidoreductase [Chthoniobacteraceae bacterium]